MASEKHQIIAGLIARKMRQEGYEIISFDGNEKIVSDIALHIPPYISRHRPDIIGVDFESKKLCIGEAKTNLDLKELRTKEQFLDFSGITAKGAPVKLIIGIPQSAENILLDLLCKIKLTKNPNISYIWVPDELLEDEKIL